jgi:hypothetical protein
MYSNELPTRLIEQVTKIGDRTLLTIEQTHHLSAREIEKKGKKVGSVLSSSQFEFRFCPLTRMSVWYANWAVWPMFRSNGWGGAGSSAPGTSCAAGSSHTHEINISTTTSWVLGPAAARRCLSMGRQYSSAQSWSTLLRRKTETPSEFSSLCHVGCGSKKFCASENPQKLSAQTRSI